MSELVTFISNAGGSIVSKNILCVPKESDIRVEGLVELC